SLVVVNGALSSTGTGTVIVTNLGAAVAVGDKFVLFNQPVPNGATMTVTGGGSGVVWTNLLAVDGSIQVLTAAPPINPLGGRIQSSVTGNTLNLSWPTNAG